MYKFVLTFFFIIYSLSSNAQSLSDLYFGTDATFDVLTWNIEWFPKNDQITVDSVRQIIEALDVDLIGLQEIDNIPIFNQLVNSLEGYETYYESGEHRGLAYIYKTSTIEITDSYRIYNTSSYWNTFPRSPLVIEFNFQDQAFVAINNHFKCCGNNVIDIGNNNDEEYRRLQASNLLKEYIDTNFPERNVLLLGDLNDNLSDSQNQNVFQSFIEDTSNYVFADMELALMGSSQWSYPNWPSHLDHLLISNELFDEFEGANAEIQTIRIDDYMDGFWQYDELISDHRPVGLKIELNPGGPPSNLPAIALSDAFKIAPNPSKGDLNFSFEQASQNGLIVIYNSNGQEVLQLNIPQNQSSLSHQASTLDNGLYYIQYIENGQLISADKLILMR